MDTAIFETDDAIFSFALPDVLNLLSNYSSEHQVEEATELLKILRSMPGNLRKVSRHNKFFMYITLDLLGKGKGSVFCKSCKTEYPSTELQSTSIGFGKNPLAVNLKKEGGIIKRLFRKRIRMGMMGGERYLCPNNHELISMITWIT
jgi:hypothetical protein